MPPINSSSSYEGNDLSIEQLNQDYVVGKLTAFEAVVEILRRLDERNYKDMQCIRASLNLV